MYSIRTHNRESIENLEYPMSNKAEARTNKGPTGSPKRDRLQVRLDQQAKAVLERAASYSHKTVSQFVLETSLERADQVIHDKELITLSPDDWQRFQDALIDPPAPNAALRKAFAGYLTATE